MPILRQKKKDPVKRAKERLVLLIAVFFIGFSAISFRLADLTLVNVTEPENIELSEKIQNIKEDFDGFRAPILDFRNEPLALSLPLKSLYADTKYIKNPKQDAKEITKLFPSLDEKRLEKKLASGNRFVWIKRHLSPDEQYEVNRLGIPGLNFKDEFKRFYPQKNTTAHVTGYTGLDNFGLSGIERSYNERLMTDNAPLKLTIDHKIQHITKDALNTAIKDFNAVGGAALVMDAKTGAIRAMVSLPDFDPHNPGNAKPKERFNTATLGVFEMGSTFKIFSAAAALELGGIDLDDKFDCRKPVRYGRFTINDYHAEKRIMTVPEIFMHSSNIGHVLMAEKVGTDKMKAFYKKLGFFERPNFDIQELGSPLIPNPWRDINTATSAYGHGLAITPIQLVSSAASMVNGGHKVYPHLVAQESIYTQSEEEVEQPHQTDQLISPQTSDQIRQMLRITALEGTGKKADVKGYSVGGKTGTAEKNKSGQYSTDSLISSFLGVFPMDNPQFILYVMVDEPKGNQSSYGYATGGWVAAPAVQTIISRMTSLLGIPPKSIETINNFDTNMAAYAILQKSKPDADSKR
tara:strand:+ start:56 stop:1786 length:1731 start_codon:yes stop_codon:yes gene_type:complete